MALTKTILDSKSGKEMAKSTGAEVNGIGQKYSKSDARYWQGVIYRPTYTTPEGKKEVPDWAVRMQCQGRRGFFVLETPERRQAAAKARDIYLSLKSIGWEQTIQRYNPSQPAGTQSIEPLPVMIEPKFEELTVGKFLIAAKAVSTVDARTIEDYCRAFRTIIANAILRDYSAEKQKRKEKRLAWHEKVSAVPLAKLTPEVVAKWKIEYLRRAAGDPVQLRRAKNNVNSTMRKAKSLYSKKLLPLIGLKVPIANPFEGVAFEPRTSMRYRSGFDFEQIIGLAMNGSVDGSVSPLPFEQWKIFLLASMAGLRRNEIDKLEWAAFRWDECLISIQATTSFRPKSEESLADVEVDPEFMSLFREYRDKTNGDFVIYSPVKARTGTKNCHYRAEKQFRELLQWLRSAGVPGTCAIHTLRKEYGSQMCAKHGIYAASRALRHADIHITSMHYLDKRERSTLGMGSLLAKPKTSSEQSELAA
jgi:integrase